jgi:hypothetical protein
VIEVDDLAVTADADQMYLVQRSTGRRVIPRIPHALDTIVQSPPLARFLGEVADARSARFGGFDLGAARVLPYVPRIRYRRAVLAAARWILTAADLLGSPVDDGPHDALSAWRQRWRVPARIVLCHGELRLPLDLDQSTRNPGVGRSWPACVRNTGRWTERSATTRSAWPRPTDSIEPFGPCRVGTPSRGLGRQGHRVDRLPSRPRRARRPAQPGPGRGSWCYGTAGIARAEQLAAIVTDDHRRVEAAEDALAASLADPQLDRITEPGLCHGLAGMYQTAYRAARDARTPALGRRLPALAARSARHAGSLGDQDNDGGLLTGSAGVALALETSRHAGPPRTGWDACLLII